MGLSMLRGWLCCFLASAVLHFAHAITCGPYESTSLKTGDTSVVCIEYSAAGTKTASSYVAFNPKVDQFASFDLNEKKSCDKCWSNSSSTPAQVRASVGKKTTGWVALVDSKSKPKKQVSFLT